MGYYNIGDLVAETKRQTRKLEDIALSLEILSGRRTLKEYQLEQKLHSLRDRLDAVSTPYPKVSPEQKKVLKEMDEVMEELRKERGEE